MTYAARIKQILTSAERLAFRQCSTPLKIQNYLDSISINFELHGETYYSPRQVIRQKSAHCFEGAIFAAAAMAYHGRKALLMDFQTLPNDTDHVVALFRENGFWGAMSKTNHAILRWRDPVYKNPRELALSYFHEYMLWNGKKSMVAYSVPFDLSRYAPETWITAEDDLDALAETLDSSRHFPIVPKKNRRLLRPGSMLELKAMSIVEWKEPRGYHTGA